MIGSVVLTFLCCSNQILALRIEEPTQQEIDAVRNATKARLAQMNSPSYLQRGEQLLHMQTPNFAAINPNANSITTPLTMLPGRAQEFAIEAREDHGDQWAQIALQRFKKLQCPSNLLEGSGRLVPSWTSLALKDGGIDIDRSTNGVFLDWMRYGNYCGNQMHGNGYGEGVAKGTAACNDENKIVTDYEFHGLNYEVCRDCGLDAGCALHDSSWVHQAVNAQKSEKGPTMCAANEAFASKMHEATHGGCTKNFKDGFGVPEAGYLKLAKCAMIFAPCINYEGPSIYVLQKVNPSLYRQCKLQSQGPTSSNIKFLACVATHYMNYRVPLGDYSGIKLKCTPDDTPCFIQGDARSAVPEKEDTDPITAKDFFSEGLEKFNGAITGASLLERSHSRSGSSGSTSCGPIYSPTLALCRAIARHVVVSGGGEFSLASDDLVAERAPLQAQDLIALDEEINSDPEIRAILLAAVGPLANFRREPYHSRPGPPDNTICWNDTEAVQWKEYNIDSLSSHKVCENLCQSQCANKPEPSHQGDPSLGNCTLDDLCAKECGPMCGNVYAFCDAEKDSRAQECSTVGNGGFYGDQMIGTIDKCYCDCDRSDETCTCNRGSETEHPLIADHVVLCSNGETCSCGMRADGSFTGTGKSDEKGYGFAGLQFGHCGCFKNKDWLNDD